MVEVRGYKQQGRVYGEVMNGSGRMPRWAHIIQRATKETTEEKRDAMTHENSYDNLSEDVKAKLHGCETPEEILALAQEEGYDLTDEQLEGVSGGWGSKCNDYNPCFDDGRNPGE